MTNEKITTEKTDIPLGSGRTKLVFLEPKGYARADFTEKLSKPQSESVYYVAKIAHTLFPSKFSKPISAWYDKDGAHFRSEYVPPDEMLNNLHHFDRQRQNDELSASTFMEITEEYNEALMAISERRHRPEIESFIEACHASGLLFVENAPANFSLAQTQQEESNLAFKYIDKVPAWHVNMETLDIKKVHAAAQMLPEDKKRVIEHCLLKIQELQEQEHSL